MLPHPPSKVLVVCLGNICRSPTAQAVLEAEIQKAKLPIQVDSAGTEGYHTGAPPDHRAIRHARRRGYELSGLRARKVDPADFSRFDLILAADPSNLAALRHRCPAEHHHKLALFLGDRPIPDPYHGEDAGFEE
ncbi:MAG: hypothetical protein RLZZ142_2558, partial [Verrucomicrobiota bacterium]